MTSEWAMTAAIELLDDEGGEIYQSESGVSLLADALDAARKQGRIEGLEETVTLLRSRAVRWRDEFQTMAATAECLADFVQYRIEELQK